MEKKHISLAMDKGIVKDARQSDEVFWCTHTIKEMLSS